MNQIIENQYFGNINYYKILLNNNITIIDASNYYEKGGYANKCVITGANGNITLTTPLLGGRNQKTLYKDVKIAYTENWRLQHKRAIFSCYGNAPYFSFYKFEMEEIFEQRFEYLFDLNFFILKKVLKLLKCKTDFAINYNEPIALENVVGTKKYGVLNPYPTTKNYPQVFEDRNNFTKNLSILDLLFCMGPASMEVLNN